MLTHITVYMPVRRRALLNQGGATATSNAQIGNSENPSWACRFRMGVETEFYNCKVLVFGPV